MFIAIKLKLLNNNQIDLLVCLHNTFKIRRYLAARATWRKCDTAIDRIERRLRLQVILFFHHRDKFGGKSTMFRNTLKSTKAASHDLLHFTTKWWLLYDNRTFSFGNIFVQSLTFLLNIFWKYFEISQHQICIMSSIFRGFNFTKMSENSEIENNT